MLTFGFIVILTPIFPPNKTSNLRFNLLGYGIELLKKVSLHKYQSARRSLPPGRYQELSNLDKSTAVISRRHEFQCSSAMIKLLYDRPPFRADFRTNSKLTVNLINCQQELKDSSPIRRMPPPPTGENCALHEQHIRKHCHGSENF
jgi:hypothetical protein